MEKLGKNVSEEEAAGLEGKSFQDGLDAIDKDILEKFEQVKVAGQNGDMENALRYFADAENLKLDREKFYRTYGPKGPLLEVCKACGSLLAKNEVEERVNDHITGKQHMGYAKIRAKIKDFRDQVRQGKIR